MKLITVAYKKSGKLYLRSENEVEINNWQDVFDLQDKITMNLKSAYCLSPVSNGFKDTYNYHIYLEDNDKFFMDFLITDDNRNCRFC